MINAYPPLFFSRIAIRKILPGYRGMDVTIGLTPLTRNFHGSIFGGTLYAAGDPYYALMYWQALEHEGIVCTAWTKRGTVEFIQPAKSRLKLEFRLSEEDLQAAKAGLEKEGRYEKWHEIEGYDRKGELCVKVETLVVLKHR